MIQSINIITAKPGMRDAILHELAAVTPFIRAERGCLEYGAGVDTPMPDAFGATLLGKDSFILIEKWESLVAIEEHHSSMAMAQALQKVGPMVADRIAYFLEDVG